VTVSLALELAATFTTFVTMWKMGDKSLAGPIWGEVSQVVWLALVLYDGLWGILPITLALIAIHARNYLRWRREAAQKNPMDGSHGKACLRRGLKKRFERL
jgi:hypothetical protein